jgi:hypothetical protein
MTKARRVMGFLLLAASLIGAQAQNAGNAADSKPAKTKHKTQQQLEQELDQLSQKYEQLESEMTAMKAEAQKREAELAAANKLAQQAAQAEAEKAAEQEKQREASTNEFVTKQGEEVDALKGAVADLKMNSAAFVDTIQADQKRAETPNAIPFMGVGLRPGGFFAAETVDRQRGTGDDINTQFSTIPFAGQTSAKLSEFNATGRQSRVSLLAEGRLSQSTLRGYFEGDFLSAGSTSNDNQSNSYTFRMRQAWAQGELSSGWIFTGGQMWSLATEYKSGLSNLKEQIPLTIDPQYQVGFTWERQYGFRVVKDIKNHAWVGVAIEEPQTLNIGGHNLPALVYQQAGNSGGLYNPGANYSYNPAPDLVGKVAFEPGWGHYEIFSVGRFFRARVFPNSPYMNVTTASGAQTTGWGPNGNAGTAEAVVGALSTKVSGGGIGANARIPLFWNKFEIGGHVLGGDGMGRYSSSTLPDATEHASGSLELLVGGSAMGSMEWHATKRFDMYGYYGGEYVKRAFYPNPTLFVPENVTPPNASYYPQGGTPIITGYGTPNQIVYGCNIEQGPTTSANGGGDVPGSPLGCVADNRNIQEGTLGYWFRFYKGAKGMLQQGMQYSYLVRHTWQGVGLPANPVTDTPAIPGSPKAIDNMIFTSFRYYLPQQSQ